MSNSSLDIYPTLPFEWRVSGAPPSWDVAEGSGSLTVTGSRIDGSPMERLESDAFVNSFFNSSQSIYLSGLEAEVVSNSGANFVSPVGNAELNIKNSKIQPIGGELVDGASIYSTIDSADTPLTQLYITHNYPKDSLQINYEFLKSGSYSGGAIINSAPSSVVEFSGRVIGNSVLTGAYDQRACFDGASYISVENATGLAGNDGFVFVFDAERRSSDPSTVFSNLGPFNSASVSGWEIGFNSAGYQTFTYYGDFLPKIYTASTAGPSRGLYCAGVGENSLGLGRFDFDSLSLQMDYFPINNKFIRQSDDWKIGSGEYTFSGYMDSFMYMDFRPSADLVENIMASYLQTGFSEPAVIRTLPPAVTGYTGYCSGTTGTIWFSSDLSGLSTGIYTGYNFTGTGITGGLTLKGGTNLYASGDLYSGLHIYNNLLWFGLDATGTGYYEVDNPSSYKATSLAWHPDRKTLLTIDGTTSVATELNRRRKKIRNLTGNFNKPEGICYMSGDVMGFLDSSDPSNSNNASIFYTNINNATTGLDTGFMDKIETTINGSAGTGLAGITCDVSRSCFYGVTVSSPAGPTLYQIDFDGTTSQKAGFINLGGLTNYSDVHYQAESESLYIVNSGAYPSSSAILQTSLGGEIWHSTNSKLDDVAGITLANDSQKLYVISSTGRVAGASWVANQNKVSNYEFLRKETGYTSGDFNYNTYIYKNQYKTGLNFSGTTGFLTGNEEFTYTGYSNIWVLSGVTGYDGNSGCLYRPASGDIVPYQVSGKRHINLINSNVFEEYRYDRLALMGNCDTGDFVEIQSPLFSPELKYNNEGYGLYGKKISQNAVEPGSLNVVGNYGFNADVNRPGFYIPTQESLTSGANIYLNGVIQRPGEIQYSIDKFFNQTPYVSGGDYAMTGSQIFDSGTGFLLFNAITTDIIYGDLNQPIQTSGVSSQKISITNTDQYLSPAVMGISGLYNEIFLNGQKLYPGADRDYIISEGLYFHATGFITGITGDLYTIPTNTGLISFTGYGPTVFTGAFLNNNIGSLNGLRWPNTNVVPFSHDCSLLSGNQRISNKEELVSLYQKPFVWPNDTLGFSRINPHYSWTWSGTSTGKAGVF